MSNTRLLNGAALPKIRSPEAPKSTLPVIRAAERAEASNKSFDSFKASKAEIETRVAQTDTGNNAGRRSSVSGSNSPVVNRTEPSKVQSTINTIGNAAAQTGNVVSGAAQGTLKTVMGTPMVVEELNNTTGRGTAQLMTRSEPSAVQVSSEANQRIENWKNTWVPTPESSAAQFVATLSDQFGEMIPSMALSGGNPLIGTAFSYATSGIRAAGSEMIEGSGNPVNALVKGAVEAGTEYLGGKAAKAIRADAGMLSDGFKSTFGTMSEGIEEVVSGTGSSLLTGEKYTMNDAAKDFIDGTILGAVSDGVTSGINKVAKRNIEKAAQREVIREVMSKVAADVVAATPDINLGAGNAADYLAAHDTFEALQHRTDNPVIQKSGENVVLGYSKGHVIDAAMEYDTGYTQDVGIQLIEGKTGQSPFIPVVEGIGPNQMGISQEIADKLGLVPTEKGDEAIQTLRPTYDYWVNQRIGGQENPYSLADTIDRSMVNPSDVTLDSPGTLLKYAEGAYLTPDAFGKLSRKEVVPAYRGQANEFFASSVEKGFPASGAGTSWEGIGVYSAMDTGTTDMYGPTGKLPDNPYSNRGINQRAVESETPIGVVLGIKSDADAYFSPQRKADVGNPFNEESVQQAIQEADTVRENEVRVRVDTQNLNRVTELVTNPLDTEALGVVFGREMLNQRDPIQYAGSNTAESASQATLSDSLQAVDAASNPDRNDSARAETVSPELEEHTVQGYKAPEFIKASNIVKSGGESQSENEEAGETPELMEMMQESHASENNASREMSVMESFEAIEATEAAETTEATETTESTEATEAAEAAETIEIAEATESTESAEATEATEASESTESIESAESAEATEATEATEAVESTEQGNDVNSLLRIDDRDEKFEDSESQIQRGQGATGEQYVTDSYLQAVGLSSY